MEGTLEGRLIVLIRWQEKATKTSKQEYSIENVQDARLNPNTLRTNTNS